ncbi:hypothetical protein ACFQZ4_43145 [Catellatospora coxensis]
MYLVELSADAADRLPEVTGRLQTALAAAGMADPLVECYADPDRLPVFHRHARAFGALLWAAREAEPIRLARVFDGADPVTGPYFDLFHPRVADDADRERTLAYLDAGTPLLATSSLLADVVAPERGEVVPMTFRTDGRWIWPDAVAYYLAQHRLAPDPDLAAWIRAAGFTAPAVDGVAVHRATMALFTPAPEPNQAAG